MTLGSPSPALCFVFVGRRTNENDDETRFLGDTERQSNSPNHMIFALTLTLTFTRPPPHLDSSTNTRVDGSTSSSSSPVATMTTLNPETSSSPTSSTYTSLLSPPNPALELTQPPGSILINRNDPSCLPPDQLAAQLNPGQGGRGRGVASAIKSSFSINNSPGGSGSGGMRRPGPPAAVFNRRARANSVAASSPSSASSSNAGSSGSNLHRSGSGRSPLVSFAPLPPVPDLERRRSITLGIAARSNLLKTQGGARSGAGSGGGGASGGGSGGAGRKRGGGSQVLMMTDEEWEEYKRNIQQRNSM